MRSHIQASAWLLAARCELAAGVLQLRGTRSTACPEASTPCAFERAELQHLRMPRGVGARARAVLAEEAQRAGDLRLRARGRVGVEVGLVDDDEVGQLHHALLDRLQVVAGVGQLQQHEHVGHAGDGRLALADADRLDDHDVEAGGLAHQHRLARLLGHAAERAAATG